MKAKFFGLLLVAVLLMSVVAGCVPAPQAAATIKIGHEVALTGPNATWGQSENNAVKMAVDKVNAEGGVLGKKLEIIAYDNRADRLEAVNVAKRLVEQDKVVAIIGPAQSGVTNAIREVNNSAKVPVIATTATNPKVTVQRRRLGRAVHLPRLLHRPVPGHGGGAVRAQGSEGQDRGRPVRRGRRILAVPGQVLHRSLRQGRRQGYHLRGLPLGRAGLPGPAWQDQGRQPRRALHPDACRRKRRWRPSRRATWASRPPSWAATAGPAPTCSTWAGRPSKAPTSSTSPPSEDPAIQDFLKDYEAKYNADPVLPNPVMAYDAMLLAGRCHQAGRRRPTARS